MPLPRADRRNGRRSTRGHSACGSRVAARIGSLRQPRRRASARHGQALDLFPGDTIFHRVFVQGNASPHCNPPGGFGLICEISYSASKPLPATGAALIERCLQDCVAWVAGPIGFAADVERSRHLSTRTARSGARRARRRSATGSRASTSFSRAASVNGSTAARDHAFIAGRKAASAALALGAAHASRPGARDRRLRSARDTFGGERSPSRYNRLTSRRRWLPSTAVAAAA